mmetsp:Transcript_27274/g.73706  ORF Transcript_27274/g.73706 Transcript_27274/m.73706 type:complete len:261 (-) Transcript_27274:38-820(-)
MALALVHHSRCGHVPQQVLRVYLDGGQVRGGHEEIQQVVLAILVVPEHVQGPMQQPCALLQLHQGWRKGLIVDGVPQFVDVLTRGLKVLHQDVGAQLAPQRGHVALAAGAQRAVWLQQIRCHAVVAALKLELGIQVQGLHVLRANGEVLLQELHVEGLVLAEVAHYIGVLQALDDRVHVLLQLAQAGHHLCPALLHGRGNGAALVQRFVDVHGEVHHVGVAQQRELGLHDVALIVNALLLQELQEREHQVAVQVLAEHRA